MGEISLYSKRNVGAHAPTMDEPISIMLQNCCVVRISEKDLVIKKCCGLLVVPMPLDDL